MYGLPQAGFLANKLIKKRLSKHEYFLVQYTPGLWKQTWRPVTFSHVVDNFGVKYTRKHHALHLIKALKNNYELSLDWQGITYCGITLYWNCSEQWVKLTMPVYIKKYRLKFQHQMPIESVDSTHKHTPIVYRYKKKTIQTETSKKSSEGEVKRVQKIVGTLLYYSHCVESTLAAALSRIASEHTNGTE